MKKGLIIIILAITAIGYISCEKPKKEKDYRKKWVGNYSGEYITYFSSTVGSSSENTQMVIINLAIWQDSSLVITCKDKSWNPEINTDGYFIQDGERGYKCIGKILIDSICFAGIFNKSPGGTSGYEFKGKKQ